MINLRCSTRVAFKPVRYCEGASGSDYEELSGSNHEDEMEATSV